MPSVVHDFDAKLAASDSAQIRGLVGQSLHKNVGSDFLKLHKTALDNDLHGADYLAEFRHGRTRLIEAKVRREDWLPRGQEADLALETWADVDAETPGWTRDFTKLSDFIVFAWLDTGRTLLLDARLLRAWFSESWVNLRKDFGFKIIPSQRGSRTWRSETVYVPHRQVVAQLAYRQGYVQKLPGSRLSDSRNQAANLDPTAQNAP